MRSGNGCQQRTHLLAGIGGTHDAAHDRDADWTGRQDFRRTRGIETADGENRNA